MIVNQNSPNYLPTRDLVIAVDSSTTSCKVIVFNKAGGILGMGRSDHLILHPQPNRYEQSSDSWWRSLCEASQIALQGIEIQRLGGLCITHQRETFVPVDETGTSLGNGILWMDERARELLPRIEAVIGSDRFHAITGKPLTGNLTIGKIDWLREYEPGLFFRAHFFLDVQAYLVQKLTGNYSTGWGSADPTGMFDISQKNWSDVLLGYLGITVDQLPSVHPTGELAGFINVEAAKQSGLPFGLPVFFGLGDGQCGGLGSNTFNPDQAYLSLGTSVITGVNSSDYQINPGFRTLNSGFPGTYVAETALLGGAYTISWFFEKFIGEIITMLPNQISKKSTLSELDSKMREAAVEIDPGAEGLVLVPYWNSAMNPYWDAAASGIVVGWRGHHTPVHFFKAIMEGIGFEINLHLDGLTEAHGKKPEKIAVFGGGSQDDNWCQIIADITGTVVAKLPNPETTALGAGILAACGCGLHQDVFSAAQKMVPNFSSEFKPDLVNQKRYRSIFENVYRPLYPGIREFQTNLADIVERNNYPVK